MTHGEGYCSGYIAYEKKRKAFQPIVLLQMSEILGGKFLITEETNNNVNFKHCNIRYYLENNKYGDTRNKQRIKKRS